VLKFIFPLNHDGYRKYHIGSPTKFITTLSPCLLKNSPDQLRLSRPPRASQPRFSDLSPLRSAKEALSAPHVFQRRCFLTTRHMHGHYYCHLLPLSLHARSSPPTASLVACKTATIALLHFYRFNSLNLINLFT
jgi:hypothetical protein